MSRTDKDAPYWVDNGFYEPWHFCREYHSNKNWQKSYNDCDLSDEPVIKRPSQSRSGTSRGPRCHWVPCRDINPFSMPPKWFINHVWSAPERLRERVDLATMVKEYNATGEIDGDFQNKQARYSAKWLWW